MEMINFKTVFTIGKKEFLDNIRNRWFLVLSIILFIIVIVWAIVASTQPVPSGSDEEVTKWKNTITGMLGITPILIPLISIIIGFNTIAGEAESGSLYVVLSYPVRRVEALIGKFLGLGSVIAFSTIIGFGTGGIVIFTLIGTKYILEYVVFIGLTIFLGLIFLSLTICVSAFVKKRIYAIAGGIIIFFWGMIIGIVMMGILYSMGYNFENINEWPGWFWNTVYLSPADLSQTTIQKAFGWLEFSAGGIEVKIPETLQMHYLLSAHVLWFFVPFVLSYYFFKTRDI